MPFFRFQAPRSARRGRWRIETKPRCMPQERRRDRKGDAPSSRPDMVSISHACGHGADLRISRGAPGSRNAGRDRKRLFGPETGLPAGRRCRTEGRFRGHGRVRTLGQSGHLFVGHVIVDRDLARFDISRRSVRGLLHVGRDQVLVELVERENRRRRPSAREPEYRASNRRPWRS